MCAARGVGVGVAGQTGKASEGFYSNWERLAFYGQGNDARNCKGRRVGWSGGEKMGFAQMGGGWGVSVSRHPRQHCCGRSQLSLQPDLIDLSSVSDQGSAYPLSSLGLSCGS